MGYRPYRRDLARGTGLSTALRGARWFLAELGFGLDLSDCAATGTTHDLAYVSPRSGHAVCAAAGQAYSSRLFALPRFINEGGPADWSDILDGLRLTGHFLARDLLTERRADVLAARERLVDRLKRVGAA
jgi:DNA repair protein RecO (recombination protein O)